MDQVIYHEIQHKILRCFCEHRELKLRQICEMAELSYKTVYTNVHNMVERGLLESNGGRFPTYSRTRDGIVKLRVYNRHVRLQEQKARIAQPLRINIFALPTLTVAKGYTRNDGNKSIASHGVGC